MLQVSQLVPLRSGSSPFKWPKSPLTAHPPHHQQLQLHFLPSFQSPQVPAWDNLVSCLCLWTRNFPSPASHLYFTTQFNGLLLCEDFLVDPPERGLPCTPASLCIHTSPTAPTHSTWASIAQDGAANTTDKIPALAEPSPSLTDIAVGTHTPQKSKEVQSVLNTDKCYGPK